MNRRNLLQFFGGVVAKAAAPSLPAIAQAEPAASTAVMQGAAYVSQLIKRHFYADEVTEVFPKIFRVKRKRFLETPKLIHIDSFLGENPKEDDILLNDPRVALDYAESLLRSYFIHGEDDLHNLIQSKPVKTIRKLNPSRADEIVKAAKLLYRFHGKYSLSAVQLRELPFCQVAEYYNRLDKTGLDRSFKPKEVLASLRNRKKAYDEFLQLVNMAKSEALLDPKAQWTKIQKHFTKLLKTSAMQEHKLKETEDRRILKEKKSRLSWTQHTRDRRRKKTEAKLRMLYEIKQTVVDSMLNQSLQPNTAVSGPYSNIGVETCMRVLQRINSLISIEETALITVPNPIDWGLSTLSDMEKKFRHIIGY